MTPIRIKLIGAGLVIAAAATFLAFSGMREGWVYFLPVDEFVESQARWGERVRLHGKVGDNNMQVDRAGLKADFDLCGPTKSLHVAYTGVVPEMFDQGRDVVVEGRRDASGVFVADTLMTKCASKYESSDGQAPHADPHLKDKAEGAACDPATHPASAASGTTNGTGSAE